METKYITKENAELIVKLLKTCEEVHPNVAFKVRDTEECVIYTRNIEKIIYEMDGGDEEFGITVVDRETKERLGWFGVLPYEEDVVCDHTDNEYCDTVYNKFLSK